ncbi:MAG: hypothetical protein JST82_09150 [Bacteroidetes bacterium]|nr:hypothetical protein [Bacteroidota bacterium]
MKNHLFIVLMILVSCNEPTTKETIQTTSSTHTKAGEIIAADSMKITEDQLNVQYFGVTVYTTDSVGRYDIEAHYGFNYAINTIQLPIGGEHFKPLLRKGDTAYSYLVGFHFADDTIFHDYYAITATKGQIGMKYTKAYTME